MNVSYQWQPNQPVGDANVIRTVYHRQVPCGRASAGLPRLIGEIPVVVEPLAHLRLTRCWRRLCFALTPQMLFGEIERILHPPIDMNAREVFGSRFPLRRYRGIG